MAEKKNALAELAERLKWHDCHDDDFYTSVEKAQRIVEELAKVKIEAIKENPSMVGGAFINLMVECRAIAKEGLSE